MIKIFRYQQLQQQLVINIANNCSEADKSNKIVESRVLVTKAEFNTMLAKERKTRLKLALSESYKSLCGQDFSQPLYLSRDDLLEAKLRHFLEATISKRQ